MSGGGASIAVAESAGSAIAGVEIVASRAGKTYRGRAASLAVGDDGASTAEVVNAIVVEANQTSLADTQRERSQAVSVHTSRYALPLSIEISSIPASATSCERRADRAVVVTSRASCP